jgi:hypothetical protein
MADANPRPSLLPLLEAVTNRPGMYLGAGSTEYGLLLDRLWSEFLAGEDAR